MRPYSWTIFRAFAPAFLCLFSIVFAPGAEAGPPPESAAALVRSDAEADAAMFALDQFINGANDLSAIRRFYGESVLYFDRGQQPIAEVMKDKRAYVSRWPERRFTPDLATLRVASLRGGEYAVALEADFTVSNGERRVEGRALVELTLVRANGGFRVLREDGRVLDRWRDE